MTPHTHTAPPAHDGPRVVVSYDATSLWPGMDWTAYDDKLGADASPYGYGATADEAREDFLWNWMEAQDAPAN